MSVHVIARSISRPVRERLWKRSFAARILAVFDDVCSMTTPDGHVAALVLPQVGDGLLNIVVDARPNHFAAIKPGMPALLEKRRLQIRGLEVTLDRAVVWEACPDWKSLRAATMPSQIAFPCCRPSLYTTPLKAVSWFSCPVGRKAPSCQWGESPSTPPHVSCSRRPPL